MPVLCDSMQCDYLSQGMIWINHYFWQVHTIEIDLAAIGFKLKICY